jgi:hypothetical protein
MQYVKNIFDVSSLDFRWEQGSIAVFLQRS